MADSIKTVLIKDARIADICSTESYAVLSSGAQVTANIISATSKSTSSLVFQITVPSENIVIDRNVLMRANVNFSITISGATVQVGDLAFSYGQDNSFQAFPLNSLFTTSTATINNTNVSVNLKDVLAQLLTLSSISDISKYSGTTPCYPDSTYGNFAQGVGANNNALGSVYNNSFDTNLFPRGSYPLNSIDVVHSINGAAVDDSLVCTVGNATEVWVITIDATLCEPLCGLSPFIFGNNEFNSQGLLGVNNMSLVFNIGALNRFWSCAQGNIASIALNNNSFTTCELLLTYLSLQPTDVVETKNICPYIDLPRYISNSTLVLPAYAGGVFVKQQIISNSIQLSSIPDKFIICCRKQMSQQTTGDSSSFMCIDNIVINFNNSSGLLSNFSQQQLWACSVKNGSNQPWSSFYGIQNGNNATGYGETVTTTGSLLVLSPTDLSLPNYLSAGSQGNFNFQYTVTVYNTQNVQVPVELVLVCAQSGVIISQQGVSNCYTGLLTKELVLKTCEEQAADPVTSVQYERMIGGAFHNRPLTAMHKLIKKRRGGSMSGGESSGGSMAHQAMLAVGKKILSKKAHKLV
jgi:hypothetical protein